MEGNGFIGMATPLSVTKIAYQVVQSKTTYSDQNYSSINETNLFTSSIWVLTSPSIRDPLDLVFPSNEAIIEAMISLEK